MWAPQAVLQGAPDGSEEQNAQQAADAGARTAGPAMPSSGASIDATAPAKRRYDEGSVGEAGMPAKVRCFARALWPEVSQALF